MSAALTGAEASGTTKAIEVAEESGKGMGQVEGRRAKGTGTWMGCLEAAWYCSSALDRFTSVVLVSWAAWSGGSCWWYFSKRLRVRGCVMQQAKGRCVMPLSKEPSLMGGRQPPQHAW